MTTDIRRMFVQWKSVVDKRKSEKDAWYELRQEDFDEEDYAINNDMDPIFWCWHCKYGECSTH